MSTSLDTSSCGRSTALALLLLACRPSSPEPPEAAEEHELVPSAETGALPDTPVYLPPEGMKEALNLKFVPVFCFGAKINLHDLGSCDCQGTYKIPGLGLRAFYCGDAFYDIDLREALDIRLIPHAETVAVRGKVRVDLIIENRTEEVVPMIFSYEFMYHFDHDVIRVFNEAGVDVTRQGDFGGGSRGHEILIALEPHGQAILEMNWWPATIVGKWSDSEEYPRLSYRPEWLPPGKYTLKFHVPFYSEDKVTEEQLMPSATITVVP